MFELDRFIEDCKTAVAGDGSHKAVRELVAAAVADRPALIAALGEPTRGSVGKLYQSDRLTILNLVWAPGMVLLPHNHNM